MHRFILFNILSFIWFVFVQNSFIVHISLDQQQHKTAESKLSEYFFLFIVCISTFYSMSNQIWEVGMLLNDIFSMLFAFWIRSNQKSFHSTSKILVRKNRLSIFICFRCISDETACIAHVFLFKLFSSVLTIKQKRIEVTKHQPIPVVLWTSKFQTAYIFKLQEKK